MTSRFWPEILALRLKTPDAVRVKVVKLPDCLMMSAPLAMVRLPEPFWVQLPKLGQVLPATVMLTLLLTKAAEIKAELAPSMVKSIGSTYHNPALPLLELVSIDRLLPRETSPAELVSIKPPLPLR